MKKKLFLWIIMAICLMSLVKAYSQKQERTSCYIFDQASQPPEMIIDIQHLKAEVTKLEPKTKYVETRTTYTFKPLRESVDSITFYSPGMKVSKCMIDKAEAEVRSDGTTNVVFTKKNLQMGKEYTIYFETSNYLQDFIFPVFSGWDDTTNTKRKQIWGFAYSMVFPNLAQKHDLLTTELIFTFDSRYKVFSNGERKMQKDNKDGTTTWHYLLNRKHYFGLLTFVVGEYEYKIFKTDRGLPLEYWYYPEMKENFESTYRYSSEMFNYLERELGLNYPWEIYRQVPIIDCFFGGMETTTATIFNDIMQCDNRSYLDKNYVNVNVHELVHQWFGNYNSYFNNKHTWTSESFATYYAKKFEQYIFGEDHYQYIRDEELAKTLEASRKDDYPVEHNKGGSARWYPKGSLVLDMLRYVMGENEFKAFIKYYLHKHQYAVVEGNDIKTAARESTGMAIDWFLDQWIKRAGEPHYKVSYRQLESLDGKRNTIITTEQIHTVNGLIGYFRMPVVFEVHYTDGSFDSKKAWVDNQFTEVIIPNNEKKPIAFVLFDPNRNILKKLTFSRSFDELSSQILGAKNMIDRYDALTEIRNTPIDKKRDLLIKAYDKETFHMTKAEIISQLSDDTDVLSLELMKKAIADSDVEVRRAVVNNVKAIDARIMQAYERMLTDSSYNIIAASLENLAYNYPLNIKQYLETTKDIEGSKAKNVRIKWLEIAYENSGNTIFVNELIEYSDIKIFDTYTVMNAIKSLKRLNYLNSAAGRYLIEAATCMNRRLNPEAKEALAYFNEQNAYRKLLSSELKAFDRISRNKLIEIIR